MGRYDSPQIADLVGLYILDILSRIVSPEQIGLYHFDGIIYITNINGVLLKCPHIQIAFLKFTSYDNLALIGYIPISAVAVDLNLR